ncbi:MAG: VOC family protein [Thermoanaerobaculia bacterium]
MKFDCFFYYVSDLDRSIRFFSDVLGLSLSSRLEQPRARAQSIEGNV